MRTSLLILITLLFSAVSSAQNFIGTGGAIPDNGNSVTFFINVTGLPTTIDTANFGLEEACLNITHTYDSDLDITLIAPDGTSVLLVSGAGGSGDNFIGTCLRSDVTTSILSGSAPFFGQYRPLGQIGNVNNGQDPNGIWTLHILDTYPFADQGTLLGWAINFTNNPATVFSFESSNLPIVRINTNGTPIGQGSMITAQMGVVDNGPGIRNYMTDSSNDYNGFIGIEIRGHSSSGFPQKQYNVETRDSAGNNLNVSLLGMPAENDWVLYAPYNDKSLMRNTITYGLANQMGRYASRARYCEVVINGEYKGVYTFFEKVKRDNNRVSIAGLTTIDTTGAELTGGYICSVDWIDNSGWTSNYPPDPTNPNNNTVFYQYIYPKDDEILSQQETYIRQFVDSFETALSSPNFADPVNGWRRYAGEGSFIDYFLMNELSKNVDGYRLSTFFYKEKITDGNKIHMGPLWDFNLAWHNADYCDNQNPGGWAYEFTDYCQWDFPFWWRRLDEDTTFQNNVRCRWDFLRTNVLDTVNIFNYIDSLVLLLDESQQRHYFIYPVLGTYLWPNPAPLAQTYTEEINNMKDWIRQRLVFMDANLPGNCITSGIAQHSALNQLNVFPNPASENVSVTIPAEIQILDVYDILGNLKFRSTDLLEPGKQFTMDISTWPSGVYMIKAFSSTDKSYSGRFVKK